VKSMRAEFPTILGAREASHEMGDAKLAARNKQREFCSDWMGGMGSAKWAIQNKRIQTAVVNVCPGNSGLRTTIENDRCRMANHAPRGMERLYEALRNAIRGASRET
jgi:hypothetical protein